jgi:hypothetical protein
VAGPAGDRGGATRARDAAHPRVADSQPLIRTTPKSGST